jgi:hypothetical protein
MCSSYSGGSGKFELDECVEVILGVIRAVNDSLHQIDIKGLFKPDKLIIQQKRDRPVGLEKIESGTTHLPRTLTASWLLFLFISLILLSYNVLKYNNPFNS